jgi:myo-inositol-1-phosphate synthase
VHYPSFRDAHLPCHAVRLAKLALNDGIAGALEAPSSYLMKSPPKQVPDVDAYEATEGFIRDNARKPAAVKEGATAN